ncbi:MAG: serine hydrolase [Ferruginibacter sp.]|nr:serine hydrolase [Chitinophagaceae bacterium]
MKKNFFLLLLLLPVIIVSFKPVKENDKPERLSEKKHTPVRLLGLNNNFPSSQYFPATPKFNAVLFEEAVNKKMKNLVKGYAFAIGDKDGIKARSEGGWAQDPADGNLRMTTRIPSCIGSVSKMMSSVALLNLLEAMPEVKLDDPVFSKLPKKWQQKYAGTQVECITYRQLLQHRSGFAIKSGDIANLEEMAKKTKSCPFIASRSYSNANISLLRYIITGLAYPQEVPAIEKKLADLPFDEYTEQANIDYSFPYERYIKKVILDKGLVPITASCRPEPDFMPKVAKEYSDRNDTKGALTNTASEHIAKGNHCAPQGSWYLSAEMLVHFGRTLLFSNNYLTNTTKNLMFNEDKWDDRLGWASFESHEAFGKETGQAKWPWHNGGQDGYFALLMQLPNGFVGSVLINSYLDNNKAPYNLMVDVLMDAFYEASHSAPVAEIAKHGIAESNYQEEFSMIWNSGYYPVWVDAYDVAGKTYFNTVFRPNTNNYDVKVRHDMTKESYQQEYNEWVKQKGYRLQQLDNYNDGGKLKLAAIFIKKTERQQAQPAYHALSPEEHQTLFDKYTGEGYVPVNVSVVFVGGKRYYSAFYEKRNVGGSVLKSFLTQQEYQQLYDDMDKKHWEQVYINAYHYDGQTRFSVIWYEKSGYQTWSATRKSTSDGYQEKWQNNTANGLLTRCVTGYEEGGKHWYAAHWAK